MMRNGRLVPAKVHKRNEYSFESDSDTESEVSFYNLCGGAGKTLYTSSPDVKRGHFPSTVVGTNQNHDTPMAIQKYSMMCQSQPNISENFQPQTLFPPICKTKSAEFREVKGTKDVTKRAQGITRQNNTSVGNHSSLSFGSKEMNRTDQKGESLNVHKTACSGRINQNTPIAQMFPCRTNNTGIMGDSKKGVVQRRLLPIPTGYRNRSYTYTCSNVHPESTGIVHSVTYKRDRSNTFPRKLQASYLTGHWQ